MLRLRGSIALTRGHLALLLLLFNSFSWYFLGQLVVLELTRTFELLAAVFPISIMISAVAGSVILPRARRNRVLYLWLFFGTALSLLPALRVDNSFEGTLVTVAALGGSLGLGMPLLLTHFSESLPAENRGTIGGLTFFLVTVSAPFIIIATSEALLAHDMLSIALFLALWRCWSIPTLLLSPARAEPQAPREKRISFTGLLGNRAFVLYFIAWLMFSMVDGFEQLTVSHYSGAYAYEFEMKNIAEPVIAGVSALIGGILADRAGRRRIIIAGFVSIGIAYAVLGIVQGLAVSLQFLGVELPWLLYYVVDGFAIGLLWTMFTVVIWGELAARGTERYYALGEAPFFMTQVLYLLLMLYFPSSLENISFSFTLAAFFLFIAVIPLFYAPETLPERKIHERQLRVYTEEAIKLKQKSHPV